MSSPIERVGPREGAWIRPSGAVTGIGSLPTNDPTQALEFVEAYTPSVPFCPQPATPHLLSDTLDQQLEHASETTDRWLEHFVRAVDAGAFPQALALKSQITGPITLAGLLGAEGRGRLRPRLIDTLAEHVARRAVHQARRLLTLGLPVLIFADEPALVLTDPQQIIRAQVLLNGIFGRIRLVGARTGLHCCATTRPAWLTSFGCDVVSFDASQVAPPNEDDISVMGDPQRILAFGLIRARQEPEQAGSAFTRWLTAASMVGDPPALAARTIVSSRCGLGRCTFAEAEVTFRAVREVAALVSACAGVVRSTDTGA